MLTFDELRDALRTGTSDLHSLVAERRAELAAARPAGPKPYLGEPPAEAERHEALERFYGSGGTALEGVPAAPGWAEGPARVVAGPADFARIQPGDVLVTTTTTPAWTPLFPSLGALVTETGGILCHAAVVAREYRIPAVVGARGATTEIPDGARVRRGRLERRDHAADALSGRGCPFARAAVRLGHDHPPEEESMKYMLLIHQGDTPTPHSPDEWGRLSEDEQKAIYADYQAINETPGVSPGV